MLMAAPINSPPIPSSPCRRFSILSTPSAKFLKVPPLCCLRKNGEINGLSRTPSPIDPEGQDDGEMSLEQSSNVEVEMKNNEIWKLFKEAQRNILYLNKERLKAVKELSKANTEKQLLIDKIEQLEKEKRGASGKDFIFFGHPCEIIISSNAISELARVLAMHFCLRDNLALCWELLLRIDSMVLGGMISTAEASNLRRMVMDSKANGADVFLEMLQKGDAELLAELRHFSEGSKMKGFHVIHVCTEMEPLVSIGPLAPYITGLSRALQRKGHLVEVILPKYASLDLDEVQGLRELEAESYSYFSGQLHGNRIWTGVVYGIGVTFIQPLYFSSFFSRDQIYDYPDDFERFTYFSRASLDYIAKSGKQPDVLHLHNWETAIVGPLFWDIFAHQGLGNTRILLTCHGFDSQCLEEPDKLALCGLDPGRLHRPDRLQDTANTHLVNILKGGIIYSNKVVVMSSMHSKGRVIRSMSHGLEHTLALHKEKLLVAPHGFDNSTWDPSKDTFLPVNYSAENMRGKDACKVALQHQAALSEHASSILVGCIFSEVSDFELENLKAVVRNATKGGAQFVFMGNGAVPTINRELRSFQEEVEDGHMKFFYRYDEALSHLIFAGSDIILCQSFDDHLLQVLLTALKYGAAPISMTSGDKNFRYSAEYEHEITKFAEFMRCTFGNMSLSQALDEIKNNPLTWKRKIRDAMTKDFSWDGECCDIHVSAYTSIKSL